MSLTAKATELNKMIAEGSFTNSQGDGLAQEEAIRTLISLLTELRANKGCVFLLGNGGSAAVVSHILTDYVNIADLNARTLHESSLLTCISNDYGYENSFSLPLSKMAQKQDILFAVSSSGNSKNIRNAATVMSQIGGTVITLTGFKRDNPLRSMGDINFWFDSDQYGLVEIGHLFLLHHLSDCLKQ